MDDTPRDPTPAPPASSSSDDREGRIAALRSLAQGQVQQPGQPTPQEPRPAEPRPRRDRSPAVRQPAPWTRATGTRRGPWIALGLVVLVAVIVAAVALHARPTSRPPVARQTLPLIQPTVDGINCVADAAFAPNGGSIALVGYQESCPHPNFGTAYTPGSVVVYDTRHHQRVAQFNPDDFIARTLHLDLNAVVPVGTPIPISGAGTKPTMTIMYQAVDWSPDGSRLALVFVIRPALYSPVADGQFAGVVVVPAPATAGILVTNPDGSHPQLIAAPYDPRQPTVEWDLQANRPFGPDTSLAPTLSYKWDTHGHLLPQAPLSATGTPVAAPLAPVGNPDGGASFTIWQPGRGGRVGTGPGDFTPVIGLYAWTTPFIAWSPDARYVVLPAFPPIRVVGPGLPTPPPAQVAAAGYAAAPLLPVRDAGLASVYTAKLLTPAWGREPTEPARPAAHCGVARTIHASTSRSVTVNRGIYDSFISWRPDGAAVAVTQDLPGDPNVGNEVVTVFDCRTGKPLAKLTPQANTPPRTLTPSPFALSGSRYDRVDILRWSADGSHLMLLNTNLGTITLWSGANLRQA